MRLGQEIWTLIYLFKIKVTGHKIRSLFHVTQQPGKKKTPSKQTPGSEGAGAGEGDIRVCVCVL